MDFPRPFLGTKLAIGVIYRNRRSRRTDKDVLWDYLSLSVVLLGTALVILTFHDYGITWDEPLHNWYGNFIIDNYQLFFKNNDSLRWDVVLSE